MTSGGSSGGSTGGSTFYGTGLSSAAPTTSSTFPYSSPSYTPYVSPRGYSPMADGSFDNLTTVDGGIVEHPSTPAPGPGYPAAYPPPAAIQPTGYSLIPGTGTAVSSSTGAVVMASPAVPLFQNKTFMYKGVLVDPNAYNPNDPLGRSYANSGAVLALM